MRKELAPFSEKQEHIIEHFRLCKDKEAIYQTLMNFGKELSAFPEDEKIEDNLVRGCQSIMYVSSTFDGEHISFMAASDALISAGLAAILITVYSNETPETILKYPPTFLEEAKITENLTPGRSNGLASLYLHMKKIAMYHLLQKAKN